MKSRSSHSDSLRKNVPTPISFKQHPFPTQIGKNITSCVGYQYQLSSSQLLQRQVMSIVNTTCLINMVYIIHHDKLFFSFMNQACHSKVATGNFVIILKYKTSAWACQGMLESIQCTQTACGISGNKFVSTVELPVVATNFIGQAICCMYKIKGTLQKH